MATVTTIATNMNNVYYLIATPTYIYGLVGGSLPIHIAQYNLDGTTHNATWYTFPNNTIFQKGTIIGSYMYLISNTYTHIVQIHINTDGTLGSVNNTWALIPNSDKGSDITSHNSTLYFSTLWDGDRSIYSIVVTNGVIGNISPFIIGSIGPMLISDTNVFLRTNTMNKYDLSGVLIKDNFFTPYSILGVSQNNEMLYGNCIYMAYFDVYQSTGTIVQYDLNSGIVTNTQYTSNSIVTFQMVASNSNIYLINKINNQMLTISLPSINAVIPPKNWLASIDINFSATISGAPIGGVIFKGYYGIDSNNTITGFYDLSDLTKNLILNDSVATYMVNAFGGTINNASTTYMNQAYISNIPYISAIFKSNPICRVSQNSVMLIDNYGKRNITGMNTVTSSNGTIYSAGQSNTFGGYGFTCTCTPISSIPSQIPALTFDYSFFGAVKYMEFVILQGSTQVLDSYMVFMQTDALPYPRVMACYTASGNSNILLSGDGNVSYSINTHSFGQGGGLYLISIPLLDSLYPNRNNYNINTEGALFDILVKSVSGNVVPSYNGVVLNRTNTSFTMATIAKPLVYNNCFSKGTLILTDQGEVAIDKINPEYHTINQNKIQFVTRTQNIENYLISIEKDALGTNIPSKYTEITGNHLVFYNKLTKAINLVNNTTIKKIQYNGLPLYNILMEQHSIMSVNNMLCETLNPTNPIASLYYLMEKNPEKKQEIETMWNKGILSK